MFATGVTMGLSEWIIDDTCLYKFYLYTKERAPSVPLVTPLHVRISSDQGIAAK